MKRSTVELFFPLPKSIFCLGLTTGELAVYSYLMYLENRKTYKCWPSFSTIGNAINKSKNSVKKYVDGLVDKGLITVEPTKVVTENGQVHNGTLMYTILPIREVMQRFNERQLERAQIENERRRIASARRQSGP